MYALASRLDPSDLYSIAFDAYRAMLAAEFTAVAVFHYMHRDPDGLFYADRAAMALFPALYAHGEIGGRSARRVAKALRDECGRRLAIAQRVRCAYAADADVVVGVCAHSLRAVPPAALRALVDGSPRDVPVHIHVAEQLREVEAARHVLGARPVAWLLENAPVDERCCLVHATHLDDSERHALARSGAVVGLCPTTEANLGDGIFALGAQLDGRGSFGIGSDSNVSIDVVGELLWLEYGQRLASMRRQVVAREPGVSCGEALSSGAIAGGARAVGRRSGALATGYRADLVSIESDAGGALLLDRYIFATDRAHPLRTMLSGSWQN